MSSFTDLSGVIDLEVFTRDIIDAIDTDDLFEEISDFFYRNNVDDTCETFAEKFIDSKQMIPIAKKLIEYLNKRIETFKPEEITNLDD